MSAFFKSGQDRQLLSQIVSVHDKGKQRADWEKGTGTTGSMGVETCDCLTLVLSFLVTIMQFSLFLPSCSHFKLWNLGGKLLPKNAFELFGPLKKGMNSRWLSLCL